MEATKASQFSGKIIPIILLVFAILSTAGIYWYNMHLESENEKITQNISETKSKIVEIQKDPNLQVFKLLTDNKRIIDKLTSQSQVTTFIKRLAIIENKYLLNFGAFNYSNGVISTWVITSPDSSLSAYSIVTDFIQKYRADKNTYFTLPFINQVSWSDSMKLNVEFTVKDKLPEVANDNEVVTAPVKTNKQTILEKIEQRNQKVQSENEAPKEANNQ